MEKRRIDFKLLKERVRIEDLVTYFNLEFKRIKHHQLQGNCPFPNHAGDRNSGSFGIDTEKDIYNCLSHCGSGKNCIDFYCAMTELDRTRDAYKAALQIESIFSDKLAQPVKRKKHKQTSQKPPLENPPTHIELSIDHKSTYLLNEKNLTLETLRYFKVGIAQYGSLKGFAVVPIHNSQGQKVGYAGQNIQTGKWKFYFNKSLELFNYHRAKKSAHQLGYVILVEGFYSAMYLHQQGYTNVVASMGVTLANEQLKLLKSLSKNIVLFYDNDQAGMKGKTTLLEKGIPCSPVQYADQLKAKPNLFEKEEIRKMISDVLLTFS